MNEMRLLMGLELRSLYGINKFHHMKDKKEKKRYRLLASVWIFLIFMIAFYVGALVAALCMVELSDLVSTYLVLIATALILIFELFKAGTGLFSSKGFDILASMPLSNRSLVCSRFLVLYLQDLALTLLIMLPGMGVYAILERPDATAYPAFLISCICVPAIPLLLATILGTMITAISARMRHKSLIHSLLSVLLVVGVLMASFSMQNFDPTNLANMVTTLSTVFNRLYAPSLWIGRAMTGGSFWGVLWFLLLSGGLILLAIPLMVRLYPSVSQRLRTVSAKHDYALGTLDRRGLLSTLYRREVKRYFSSSIYVTNTIIGPIMASIMAVALYFVGLDTITGSFPFNIPVVKVLPFALTSVFCMMTTTSTAISMEGRSFWAIQSLPVPTKTLLDAKILLNLSLMLPFYLLSEIFLLLEVKPSLLETVWFLLVPAILMLFSVVLGISVNLKFHSFNWEKEEQVVKQSGSAMLGGFAGTLFGFALLGLMWVLPTVYADVARLVICLLVGVLTLILYRRNNRISLETL